MAQQLSEFKFTEGTLECSEYVRRAVPMKSIASTTPSEQSGGTAGMLPEERKRASFNVDELLTIVAGKKVRWSTVRHNPLEERIKRSGE